MRSIPYVMIRDMLWNGKLCLIAGFLGASIMPILLFTALRQHGPLDTSEPSFITIHVTMIQINVFVFAAMIMSAQRAPARTSRMYTLPVSTTTLVTWHILPAMVLVSLEVLCSTLALNWMYGLDWPVWGPTLFAAVAMVAIQAAICQTENPFWLASGLAVIASIFGCWFKSRYGAMFSLPSYYWREVTINEIVTMALFGGLSFYAAVVGIARNRRGDVLPSFDIAAWYEKLLEPRGEIGPAFRSPLAAQAWFNWCSRGFAMPAGAMFLLVLGVGIWPISIRNLQELVDVLAAAGAMLSVLALVGGMILGNLGANDTNFDMGHFLATRPISTPQLAKSILKTGAKSLFISWSIWAVPAIAVMLVLMATGFASTIKLPEGVHWWYLPATLLGGWIVLTTVMASGLTGRPPLFLGLFVALFFFSVSGDWVANNLLTQEARAILQQCFSLVLGTGLVIATAWMFALAWRNRFVQTSLILVCVIAWVAMSALVLLDSSFNRPQSWTLSVLVIGLLALVVAPFATTPLAISWNRHR